MDTSKIIKSLSNKSYILVPHLERYLAQGDFPPEWNITIRNKKEKRDYGEADIRFSPSSDTLESVENLVKKYTTGMPEEPISAGQRLAFDVGTMWHEYLQRIIVHMGLIDESGVEKYMIKKIERQHGIAYTSGLGDFVGLKIPGYGKWLVDVKTMNANSFKTLPSYMMQKYVAQINLYGDWWDYDNLMILGVSKDSPHSFKEIIVPRDQHLIDEIYDRWVEAYSLIKEHIML